MFYTVEQLRQLTQDRIASNVRSAKAAHSTRIRRDNYSR